MAKLTSKSRNKLPDSAFALQKERKYPVKKMEDGKLVGDRKHAANAKARATQMEDKGKLSPSAKKKIDAKANKILKKKK